MQFDANDKNKQQLQSLLSKYTQQSLKAREGQTYVSNEDRLYKVVFYVDGQEVYHRVFFISIAFILHFVKKKYRNDNIGRNGDYLS